MGDNKLRTQKNNPRGGYNTQTCADDDDVWPEPPRRRRDDAPPRERRRLVAGAAGQRDVDGRAGAGADACESGLAGVRPEAALVEGYVHYVRARLEQRLGAVAVVHVKVDDEDARGRAEARGRGGGGRGDEVDEL